MQQQSLYKALMHTLILTLWRLNLAEGTCHGSIMIAINQLHDFTPSQDKPSKLQIQGMLASTILLAQQCSAAA